MIVGELCAWSRAGSTRVAPLRPSVKSAAARLAALGPVGPLLTAELRSAGSQLRLRGTRNLHRSRRFPMVRVGAWCRGRTCCGRSKRSRPLPARGSRSAQRRVVLRSFNRRAGGCSPGSRSPLRSAPRFHRWAFTVQKRCSAAESGPRVTYDHPRSLLKRAQPWHTIVARPSSFGHPVLGRARARDAMSCRAPQVHRM